jgi:hypothetical protein
MEREGRRVPSNSGEGGALPPAFVSIQASDRRSQLARFWPVGWLSGDRRVRRARRALAVALWLAGQGRALRVIPSRRILAGANM